jgi:hypothetical protein
MGRGVGGEGLRAQKLAALFTKASPTHLIDWVSGSPHPHPSPKGRGESRCAVIPAEAKRRAGTPMDFAAWGPGSADAVRDDSLRTEGALGQRRAARSNGTCTKGTQSKRAASTIRWPRNRKVRRHVLSVGHHWLTGRVHSVTFLKCFGQDCPKEWRTNGNWLSIRLGV